MVFEAYGNEIQSGAANDSEAICLSRIHLNHFRATGGRKRRVWNIPRLRSLWVVRIQTSKTISVYQYCRRLSTPGQSKGNISNPSKTCASWCKRIWLTKYSCWGVEAPQSLPFHRFCCKVRKWTLYARRRRSKVPLRQFLRRSEVLQQKLLEIPHGSGRNMFQPLQ